MARVIADILETDTLHFNHLIDHWEQKTGRKGYDLSLYSDMRSHAVHAVKGLGLDPSDTISGELYFALQERARHDNEWIAQRIGINPDDKPEDMVAKVVKWTTKHAHSTDVWVCKPSVVRPWLKKQPPKTVMKALGLRSIDSMLKRNNPAEIITLANELEPPEWKEKFSGYYKKCKTTDFDVRDLQFSVVSTDRRDKIGKAGYPTSRLVSPNFELGHVFLIPPRYRFPLDVIAVAVAVAEAIYDMRRHSALFRILSVRKDFSTQLSRVIDLGLNQATLELSEIGWNSIHRHLVGNEFMLSKIEQPHISADDLKAESSVELLIKLDPRFGYWKNLEYSVYGKDGKYPVSMNLVDVVTNASNKLPYDKASLSYSRMRLWEELWARYLTSDEVIEDVIQNYLK